MALPKNIIDTVSNIFLGRDEGRGNFKKIVATRQIVATTHIVATKGGALLSAPYFPR